MAKVTFKHTTHDTIKQIYVKKKSFRWLLATQITTLVILAWFSYKLHGFGYFEQVVHTLKSLANSIV